jgi:3-oxoacyl-[acyl-carrier-protein] synthase III
VAVPENIITQAETLALAARLHADHPKLRLVLRMIENTGVAKRHLIRPIDETLVHTGFAHRNRVFEAEAKKRIPAVVAEALANAGLATDDIGAIVLVSCTGFMMPSLTAWMINELGFRTDTVQLPIAQLGCAAGTAAINRASDFCRARTGAHALIVTCEFCSLCYQPDDLDVGSLLSNGLFGDAVAAAVVRGDGRGTGVRLEAQTSHVIPGTETWIAYEVKETGPLPAEQGRSRHDAAGDARAGQFVNQGHDLAALDFTYPPEARASWTRCAPRRRVLPRRSATAGETCQLRQHRVGGGLGRPAPGRGESPASRPRASSRPSAPVSRWNSRLAPGCTIRARAGFPELEEAFAMAFRSFEEFEIGAVYPHWPGKTVTEYDTICSAGHWPGILISARTTRGRHPLPAAAGHR